jgi:hypothetical protein
MQPEKLHVLARLVCSGCGWEKVALPNIQHWDAFVTSKEPAMLDHA